MSVTAVRVAASPRGALKERDPYICSAPGAVCLVRAAVGGAHVVTRLIAIVSAWAGIHEEMLKDAVRTKTYMNSIMQVGNCSCGVGLVTFWEAGRMPFAAQQSHTAIGTPL